MSLQKPKQSKLLKLKRWLTLDDTARHLSIVVGEEVTRADVLRLAIDGHLKLSVDFVNHTRARKGRLIPFEQCTFKVIRRLDKALKGQPLRMASGIEYADLKNLGPEINEALKGETAVLSPEALHFKTGEYLVQEDKVVSISGVWDLPMVGGEALDIEHHYQMETGGPEVTLTNLEGAFVERDGVICQLQADFDDYEHYPGSKAYMDAIKRKIRSGEMDEETASGLRAKCELERKKFLEQRERDPSSMYYPAEGLPEDSVLVVRTSAIHEFEQSLDEQEAVHSKPLATRERDAYLNIIGALLEVLRDGIPDGQKQGSRIGPANHWTNEAKLIAALAHRFEGFDGLSKSNLERKFPVAKRNLEQS